VKNLKRREFIKYGLIFTIGIGISAIIPNEKEAILPPKASQRFLELCTSCGRCIDSCPTHGLSPISIFKNPYLAGKPELSGYCCIYLELVEPIPEVSERIKRGEIKPTPCTLCIDACPTGALTGEAFRAGIAKIDKSLCLGWTKQTCNRCERICPVEAVVLIENKPHVVSERCLGCRLCEKICPTKPKAIKVVRNEIAEP